MPYLTSEDKVPLDPKISALLRFAFGDRPKRAVITEENAAHFFAYFLETLYEEVAKKGEMRYRHWNALQGAYECALKELSFRWKERVTPLPAGTPRLAMLPESKMKRMSLLVRDLALTFSDNLLEVAVGEINYSISEVANALGNSGLLPHASLRMIFDTVNQTMYERFIYSYEKQAIMKNGDTAGFIKFFELHAASFDQNAE